VNVGKYARFTIVGFFLLCFLTIQPSREVNW
jgi:hypothetical protein